MKIVEIGTGYTSIPARMGAATEIVVEELVRAFMADGQEVALADIADDHRRPNQLPITEVRVPALFSRTDVELGVMHKAKRVAYSIALAGKLQQMIRSSRGEMLLHFHNQYNLYFFLRLTKPAMRRKVKIAYTVHSYIWAGDWREIRQDVRRRYFQEIYCVRNADYVFVLNKKTAHHFVKHLGIDKRKIHGALNGVNVKVYHPLDSEEIDRFKKRIGLSGRKIILQVGSVCRRKNQLEVLKMLTGYLKEHQDALYLYAGGIIDGEYQTGIDTYATKNGIEDQVRYAGELCPGEQLNRYYNAASMTVFPSERESFGLVIIESLAAGTPVLSSQAPMFKLEQGCTVYHDEREFIHFVEENINGENKGEKNRKEVTEKYSWEKAAERYLQVFGCR